MDKHHIQEVFLEFATPLVPYVQLGGRKEAMEEIARQLWMAMIAGDEAEQQFWSALSSDGQLPAEIIASIQKCFDDEMKPKVSAENLAELRENYGIES